MTVGKTDEIKQELARKVESTKAGTKLKKSMSIADMIKVMEPQIKKALPEVITPERFTRMALSALNTTPKLNECTPMSFLAALMNAAQLGLEPNTPLGQAFLIPYNNKGEMECQFQLGYKGLIDLSYRNPNMQIITAHIIVGKRTWFILKSTMSQLFHGIYGNVRKRSCYGGRHQKSKSRNTATGTGAVANYFVQSAEGDI